MLCPVHFNSIIMETISNKHIVAEFYKKVVGLRQNELIPNYVREDYIQHSPMGNDGLEGLFAMVEFLKTLPQPEIIKSPIVLMIAEGDYVVAHLDLEFMGKHVVLMELFRVQDGKAAEHWDVTEESTGQSTPAIDTQGINNNTRLSNKAFITTLYQSEALVIHHMIEEGGYIAVHSELREGGKSIALFDIFKIEENLITEHHFVKQAVPENMMHNNGMF
jgi:predicted SnoaL-like aldol condensation-catalyzing enzyme